jgi:hypothetical protein
MTGSELRMKTLCIAMAYSGAGLVSDRDDRGAEVDKIERLFDIRGDAWCAVFVLWCAIKAIAYAEIEGKGIPNDDAWKTSRNVLAQDILPSPSCKAIVADAKKRGVWTAGAHDLNPGDWVFYCWDGSGEAQHVGIVTMFTATGLVQAVEGNTANPHGGQNPEDGRGVYLKTRPRNLIIGRARVGG